MTTRERPILFSGEMVRAILDGRKSQTRRVVKPRRGITDRDDDGWPTFEDEMGDWHREACPYGQPGDRLWVRETWGRITWQTIVGSPGMREEVVYRAGPHPFGRDVPHGWSERNVWKPSIHMPRKLSRLTLEITGVRVERVQDITTEDAIGEGALFANDVPYVGAMSGDDARHAFALLWDSLNADRGFGWNVNPWVWRLEFRRVEP